MALSRAERCLVQVLRCFSRAFLALLSLALGVSALLRWKGKGPRGSRPARRAVPPPDQPLLLLSARELAGRIRRRELLTYFTYLPTYLPTYLLRVVQGGKSNREKPENEEDGQSSRKERIWALKCVDLLEAYIERNRQVNPLINAIVKDRFEAALQEAQVVDQLLSEGQEDEESLQKKFPLLGIPVTVKEAFALYGMPNSSGLVNRRNLISTTDAVVVSRLKQAGAIPLGVTNCSELCMWFESSNLVYGRSNNPYNLDCIVGGSSGGEGCILAAAGSLIGIGSDIGGSIRMPAFFNGIFGHKPTTGVVPNDGQFPDAVGNRTNFLCTGPMCRYAEDMELLLRVMAGPNISKLKLDDPASLQNIKFYSMEHDGGSIFLLPVTKEILQAHRKVVAHLETDLGIEVESVTIRKMKYSFQIWSAMMSSKSSNNQENQTFTDLLGDHGKPVWPSWELVKWMMRLSSHTFPAIALGLTEKVTKYNPKANAKLASMAQSLQAEVVELLGENGVLLYPSHPVLAPKHHAPLGMPFNFAYTVRSTLKTDRWKECRTGQI
uniref:Fatty acid amide hydrolase 2 n=1 Tax=Naja naja TaxID=35670 RepID=A0A8C6XT87_NAJNA